MFNIIIAFVAGCMVILSMIVNSHLSKKVGTFQGTFINYSVGLLFASMFFLASKGYNTLNSNTLHSVPMWAYLGGGIGVFVVAISNVIIPKIPTIYSTLLIFVGQLFSGIIIDFFRDGLISKGKIIGGMLILCGMLYNFYVDNSENKVEALKC